MNNILDILTNIGYSNIKDLGNQYSMRPIYRASDNNTALTVNKSTGLWFDFVEHKGGNLASLIQLTLNLKSLEDTKEYLKDFPISIYDGESLELQTIKKFDKILLTKLIKDNTYWNKRGISDIVINQFQGGIANNGRMKDRWVFPIFNNKDDIIGFAGRTIKDNEIRWKLVGEKKKWVFPQTYDSNNKSINLVESIGDAISMLEIGYKNVLSLFGVSISPNIISFLLKYDFNKINIILNNDSNNNFVGNNAAQDIKDTLLNYFDQEQIRIITSPKKDLNEMLIYDRENFKLWMNQYLN